MSREAQLRALRGADLEAAVEAAELLGATGDRAVVGALANALRAVEPELRTAACQALGELGDARAVGPLVSLLRDADEGVRGEAFSALLSIGQHRAGDLPVDAFLGENLQAPSEALTQLVWPTDLEAIAVLLEALDDADPEVRIGAVFTLGRLGITAVFDRLAKLLSNDPDSDVRAAVAFAFTDLAAAGERRVVGALLSAWDASCPDELAVNIVRALAEIGDRDAYNVLTEALRHREPRVRQLAAMGLGRLGDGAAVPRLSRLLQDPHRGVRRVAAAALGEIRDPLCIRPLALAVHGNDAEVRATIADALARQDAALVQTHLTECLMTPDAGTRESAVYLMGRLGLSAGLRRALGDPDEQVRKTAALAMGNLGEAAFRADLETSLADIAWPVRVAAAEGLRRLGDARAVPALRRHQEDEHRVVRNAIAVALRTLGAGEP